jgi:hypothetical protein
MAKTKSLKNLLKQIFLLNTTLLKLKPLISFSCNNWGLLARFHYYNLQTWIKETTETASSASFLDIYLTFDTNGQLSTRVYDKRDDFNFVQGRIQGRAPLNLEKIGFFGVKPWFFTRNTPKFFAPPSARRNLAMLWRKQIIFQWDDDDVRWIGFI